MDVTSKIEIVSHIFFTEAMSVELHHLAGVSSDLQQTITFYHNVLGLKYIQKPWLLDGPRVCHFYWDEGIENFITFYHCPQLPKRKVSENMFGTISFSVNKKAIDFWKKRLLDHHIKFQIKTEFADKSIAFCFNDPDGLHLKIVLRRVIRELQLGNWSRIIALKDSME